MADEQGRRETINRTLWLSGSAACGGRTGMESSGQIGGMLRRGEVPALGCAVHVGCEGR